MIINHWTIGCRGTLFSKIFKPRCLFARFQEAYDYYSQAIMADPDSALLRSNRSGRASGKAQELYVNYCNYGVVYLVLQIPQHFHIVPHVTAIFGYFDKTLCILVQCF